MKILILSYYFSPDLSAGSFRSRAIAEELIKKKYSKHSVDILTTLPNRYEDYFIKAKKIEKLAKNVTIFRFQTSSSKSNLIYQSINFASYCLQAFNHIRHNQYDIIFATSSRLFTGFLGALISKYKKIPLYLDIRDIFPDTIFSIDNNYGLKIFYPLLLLVEYFTINQAKKINLISKNFKNNFKNKFSKKFYTYHTNGIDEVFFNLKLRKSSKKSKIKKVLYAGNIGTGQALEKILPDLAIKYKNYLKFIIIGSGNKKKNLLKEISIRKIKNVEIIKPLSRKKLINFYAEADLLFLHLGDNSAFEKVLPSKLFEYSTLNKPIWAGVEGFAKKFIKQEIDKCYLFQPCNLKSAENAFKKIKFEKVNRSKFITKYRRQDISVEIVKDLISMKN